jgi:hypothetical protein
LAKLSDSGRTKRKASPLGCNAPRALSDRRARIGPKGVSTSAWSSSMAEILPESALFSPTKEATKADSGLS